MLWISLLAVAAIIFLPGLWVRHVMATHRTDRPDFPGTGGELARHLLNEHGLDEIGVEITERGDHFDPEKGVVRLSRENFEGKSVTAVAIAAHEVGHAIQQKDGYRPLQLRHRMVRTAIVTDQIGSVAMVALSAAGSAIATPRLLLLGLGAVVLMGLVRVLAHLITLPVEFDASFGRALPILRRGGYLDKSDLPAARAVLKAAALTYVAGSLAQIVNLFRILRFLR